MKNASWENWVNVVLGIWIMLTPWIFPIENESRRLTVLVSDSLAGAILFGSAALALQELTSGEEWTSLAVGIWIFLSPWILGYSSEPVPFWNAVVVGAAVAGLSALALPVARGRRGES